MPEDQLSSALATGSPSVKITLRSSDAGTTIRTPLIVSLHDVTVVRDVLIRVPVPSGEIEVIAVNGLIGSLDSEVHDGDELELFVHAAEEPPLPRELRARGAGGYLDELMRAGRRGLDRMLQLVPSRMNLSWITGRLAVGGAYDRSEINLLSRMGINAVVDCRVEDSDDEHALNQRGIEFLRLPTPDCQELTQEALDRGVDWVRARLDRGAKVLVHCQHGVGRGPLLGSCVLVSLGLSPWDALTTIKLRRWQASPNEEQLNALLEFASRRSGSADRVDDQSARVTATI